MMAADRPIQRPPAAKLLVIDESGCITHEPRAHFVDHFRAGDLVIANDAATLPASLQGIHEPTGRPIEIRLAGRRSLAADDVHVFAAVVFGAGDYHVRTEHRPPPPTLSPGDKLTFGPAPRGVNALLDAVVLRVGQHERLVTIGFSGTADAVWAGLARHGRPIQYAHVDAPLALWDVWTPVAGLPVAFEPPSAGFTLDWRSLATLQRHGVRFATITHAAGISSTGDPDLDALLPFDEPYDIPVATARAIAEARDNGRRIIAIGTTVVRALEHAADEEGRIRPGFGIATQKVTATTHLKVVDVLLTGVHEPGTSHYELMRAFVDEETLQRASAKMTTLGYHTHEFGDSVLVSAAARSDLRRATLSGSPVVYTEPTLKGSAYCQDGASSGVSLSI
jgi:S-adenosylmethionine:tRNA ribosyltransferase-isomerase